MSTRLSYPLLRLILFFALSLTVALPTTALAAPSVQPTTEATILAYFESDVVTDAEGDDVVVGLSFYEDDTFEMSLDYLDGEEPTIVYGDYEETDDGVFLTAVGADGEDLDEPVELELAWDADDTLVIIGSEDGPMGEEDIILYPIDLEADDEGEEEADDDADDDADLESDDSFLFEIGGVYVSPVQPSEESDGVVYMLNLLPDGDASLSSDYLNLEPPIFELGTWTDNGDDTVTVEIVGTLEEDYEDPILIEFEIGEYGELIVDDVFLYSLEILNFLSEDDLVEEEEIGTDESEVYVYVAEVVFPDDEEPTYVYLLIYDDGTVILTDEEESETLYGEWIFEDEILTVTITGDAEEDFDEPVELVLEFDEDNALVATEYPIEVFGEEGLVFYPANDEEDEAVTEGEFYFYESDTLPSEESDGIVISLILSADGAAMVSTDFMDDEDPYLEYGEWTRDEDGAIIISISEGPDGVYDEPYVFTFEEDEDDLSLVLVEESIEVFGEDGLVLYRIE